MTERVDTSENRWCATLSGRCWACSRIQQQWWVRRCCFYTRTDSMAHLHTAHLGSKGKGRMPHLGKVIWSPLFSALQTESPPSPHLCMCVLKSTSVQCISINNVPCFSHSISVAKSLHHLACIVHLSQKDPSHKWWTCIVPPTLHHTRQ